MPLLVIAHETTESGGNAKRPPQSKPGRESTDLTCGVKSVGSCQFMIARTLCYFHRNAHPRFLEVAETLLNGLAIIDNQVNSYCRFPFADLDRNSDWELWVGEGLLTATCKIHDLILRCRDRQRRWR